MYSADYLAQIARIEELTADTPPEHMKRALSSFAESWSDAKESERRTDDSIRLPGWDSLDNCLQGIRMNEFSILCGPTGAGKTTLLANLACTFAANGTPIFVGSVETGREDFMKMMAAIIAGRNPYGWSEAEAEAATKNYAYILGSKRNVLCRYESRVDHRQLLADLLYASEVHGTKIALIDNLNFLMQVGDARNQNVEMDRTVHDFVVFVKKVPMHIVMVMHPKKTENGIVRSEFDIKGSSTAVQEAANVLLFNRLDPDVKYTLPADVRWEWCREIRPVKIRKNGIANGARIIYSREAHCPLLKERSTQ